MAAPVAPSPSRFSRRVVLFAALVYGVTHAPNWPEVKAAFFDWDKYRESFPDDLARLPPEREDLLHRGGVHPRLRARARRAAQPAGAGLLPDPRARDRLRRLLPRRADDPRHRPARLRRAGARRSRGSRPRRRSGGSSRSSSSTRRTSPRSTAPGSSRCIRARRRLRARSGSRAAGALLGRAAAGGAARHPAAPERLHRAAEGHGARRDPRARSRRSSRRRSRSPPTSTSPTTSSRRRSSSRSRSRSRASPTGSSRATGASGRPGWLVVSAVEDRGPAQVVRQARGAARDRPRRRRARGRLPDRRLRLGQVDAAPLRQPARAGRRGTHRHRRRGDHGARRRRQPHPPRDRDRLPGLQPLPAHERARQRDARPAEGARHAAAAGGGGGDRAARPLRTRRQARRLPRPALRRPAAAGRDRPRARAATRR